MGMTELKLFESNASAKRIASIIMSRIEWQTIFPLKSNNNTTVLLLLLFRGKIVTKTTTTTAAKHKHTHTRKTTTTTHKMRGQIQAKRPENELESNLN